MDMRPYEKIVKNWNDLYDQYCCFSESGRQWIFRGQGESGKDLQTTLERAIIQFSPEDKKIPDGDSPQQKEQRMKIYREILSHGLKRVRDNKTITVFEIEQGMLKKFQRQCYHYASDLPEKDATMEWLALMRHYGAPGRLLDWTYSFFVAVYFAIEEMKDECAVYSLDTDWMDTIIRTKCKPQWLLFHGNEYVDKKTFRKVFGASSPHMVYAVNPFRRNQRLTVQQGVFLVPSQVSLPFEDNLAELLSDEKATGHFYKFRIKTSNEERKNIIRHLQRMNINRAALFSDLDGFAASLKTWLAFPDVLTP